MNSKWHIQIRLSNVVIAATILLGQQKNKIFMQRRGLLNLYDAKNVE